MRKYGYVDFKKGGIDIAKLKREYILRMRTDGIIEVTDEDIETWYEEDRINRCGCIDTIVLHNFSEIRKFKALAKELFDGNELVQWEVSFRKKYGFKKRTRHRSKMKRSFD